MDMPGDSGVPPPPSGVQFFVIPWTVALQAPLSMEFSRLQYWSRVPFCSPGGLPDPGIKPSSPTLQADSCCLSTREAQAWWMERAKQ